MQQNNISFMGWMNKYRTEIACVNELARRRWPDGFKCPRCEHHKAYVLKRRRIRQCASCRHQVSVTAGTIFHNTLVPLRKWFMAIQKMCASPRGVSATELAASIEVSWRTAQLMLRKLRRAMGDRDRQYLLGGLVEVDDAFVGGKHSGGKRGRGAQGKTPVLFAVEKRYDSKGKAVSGFMTAKAVDGVNQAAVHELAQRLDPECEAHTDAYRALQALSEHCQHVPKVTPPEQAGEWLPLVHVIIGNFKGFLIGTFHGVSKQYLQEYLDEFVYRFNRKHWKKQWANRLLTAAAEHEPTPLRLLKV